LKINWLKRLKNIKIEKLSISKKLNVKTWLDIYHLVIFPMYKEGIDVVRPTFLALLNSKYPLDRLIVVLAIEERAGDQAKKVARMIEKEFKDKFFRFLITVHPKNIPGELALLFCLFNL